MTSLVIGASLFPQRNPRATGEEPGGTLLSSAVALVALGRQVRFVTDLGTDDNAQESARALRQAGVELLLRPESERPAHTIPSSSTQPLAPGEAWDILPAPTGGARMLDIELFSPLTVVFGGSAIHLAPGRDRVADWVRLGRRWATSVMSLTVRPALAGTLAHARERTETLLPLADVVRGSARDVELLWGLTGDDAVYNDVARYIFTFGPQLVALTTPDNSLMMYSREGAAVKIPPLQSGGSRAAREEGASLAALADGLGRVSLTSAAQRDELGHISFSNMYTLGAFSQAAAAFTAERRGSAAPSRDELAETVLRNAPGLPSRI